ncbi:MAG: hypothetical protein QW594_03665 [Candidatus Woesearchaeota archaeon]
MKKKQILQNDQHDPSEEITYEDAISLLSYLPIASDLETNPLQCILVLDEQNRSKLKTCLWFSSPEQTNTKTKNGHESIQKTWGLAAILLTNPKLGVIRDGKEWYLFSCGIAVERILMQCKNNGYEPTLYYACNEEKLRQEFKIPMFMQIIGVLAIGVPNAATTQKSQNQQNQKEQPPANKTTQQKTRRVKPTIQQTKKNNKLGNTTIVEGWIHLEQWRVQRK